MTFYSMYFDVLATAGTGFADRNLHDLELLESLVSQYARVFYIVPRYRRLDDICMSASLKF